MPQKNFYGAQRECDKFTIKKLTNEKDKFEAELHQNCTLCGNPLIKQKTSETQ